MITPVITITVVTSCYLPLTTSLFSLQRVFQSYQCKQRADHVAKHVRSRLVRGDTGINIPSSKRFSELGNRNGFVATSNECCCNLADCVTITFKKSCTNQFCDVIQTRDHYFIQKFQNLFELCWELRFIFSIHRIRLQNCSSLNNM